MTYLQGSVIYLPEPQVTSEKRDEERLRLSFLNAGPRKMNVLGEDDEDEMESVMREAKKQEKRLTDEEKLMQTPMKLIRQGVTIERTAVEHSTSEHQRDATEAEDSRQMDEGPRNENGQPLYFTKENVTEMFGNTESSKIEVFEKLQRSLTLTQLRAMNTTGYTVMDAQQIKLIYGADSPYGNATTYERLRNISTADIPHVLEDTIRNLANEVVAFKAQRENDIVLTPLTLVSVVLSPATASQPIVLSPLLFVPLVLSPALFGPVILSPWAFVPIIVSPRLFSPVIVSPILLSPVILSPLALHPLILSPGALVPFVLSPFVLTPFIINPVALSPLILTPFCLSPFIIVPNVLSPLILSPFVLSPLILSPPAVSAFVLTPYVLSPIIASPGALFAAVLSPSWLS
ncbi:Repetitive proline-rich cell wall protein [Trichostrongylus colubriformis]|uniref:Repetitive proline-rich cell wall protein n=1 Tax=Trichostrongylus colubriformis TaxID=6319 RepID=A0AAN8IR39_TRICO